jgi:hypothetical protein
MQLYNLYAYCYFFMTYHKKKKIMHLEFVQHPHKLGNIYLHLWLDKHLPYFLNEFAHLQFFFAFQDFEICVPLFAHLRIFCIIKIY